MPINKQNRIGNTFNHKSKIISNYTNKVLNKPPLTINKSLRNKRHMNSVAKPISKILFMPTNGGGLGHLTRSLAIAKRIKQNYPDVEIIFFTNSIAIHTIQNEGFLAYYMPSSHLFPRYINEDKIDYIMANQLSLILTRHSVDTFIFDGVYPYAFLVNTIDKFKGLNCIWIQRGMHKGGKSRLIFERERYFSKIIIPMEATQTSPMTNTALYCPPIIFADREDLLPRETVLKMWNLNPDKKTVYVQLGEGLYNDVNSLISKVVSVLKLHDNLQIVVGESIIAHKKYDIDPEILIIRDYPNSIYFNAFDFAVITASYNIFHETIYFHVPTIIFPAKETITDDHLARSKIALALETGFVFEDFSPNEFDEAVIKILDPDMNLKMRQNSKDIFENGAKIARDHIMLTP